MARRKGGRGRGVMLHRHRGMTAGNVAGTEFHSRIWRPARGIAPPLR